MSMALAVCAAFLLALLLTPLARRLAFLIGAVDAPGGRKVHQQLMPRLGGLAIFGGFMLTVVALGVTDSDYQRSEIIGMLVGGAIIVLVGILDDTRDLPAKVKLLGQVVAALAILPFGLSVDFVTNPFVGPDVVELGWLRGPITVLWIIGVTNAVNLIDGLDGLAAGIAAIASVTMAIVAWTQGQILVASLALVLAASSAGFLKHNFHPARIFMGDTGAMFLGFTLACLSIMGLAKVATVISVFIPILIVGIPILDTGFAIFRRVQKGQPIFQADKDHLHHRLLALGFSHPQTVMIIYGINTVLGATAVFLTTVSTAQSVFILILLASLILVAADRVGILGRSSSAPEIAASRIGIDIEDESN
ncbi:undecaprenyl/decaprenyl-phosphate alpha-N-acetylglucosaminyl 1-phosphate transferase [Heliobacterium undosum]|uniref:Undecaprenyl/decaprenyl-phosphate alpha-N-acetylglucosaminyl 1-phosphate transferase n=2 Tax=Heliomicrobium undosum TaxID=121734 RepID=A0A845L4D0_9FIRM|nr:undecaprenyl/decaprenyl-phosphate alpha-N-acetylglucosaminyl 1-phosphate transferase [Heliomicrobium undosum]